MCSPGVMICTFTPRFTASISACRVISSGTKYALESWIERVAAMMAKRYMSFMLSAPPDGELLNICAAPSATGDTTGKYSAP